jgi:cysteine desulfurase
LGKACEIINRDFDKNVEHMRKLRDLLMKGIKENINDIRVNGNPDNSLPNTLSVSFKNMKSNELINKLEKHICVSAGLI